jgi:predicted O-methyltransferase YrrM
VITAIRARDSWSLKIAVRPIELEKLLHLAKGGSVAEIGTGTGWCALVLAACGSEVFTCDRIDPPQRRVYQSLVSSETAERVHFSQRPGEEGPPKDVSFRLLFIDASHSRDDTISNFNAWRAAVDPGGAVAFHDYTPEWPGVAEAIETLGLEGATYGTLFVWQKPGKDEGPPL